MTRYEIWILQFRLEYFKVKWTMFHNLFLSANALQPIPRFGFSKSDAGKTRLLDDGTSQQVLQFSFCNGNAFALPVTKNWRTNHHDVGKKWYRAIQGTITHIPPNGKRKIIDSNIPRVGDMWSCSQDGTQHFLVFAMSQSREWHEKWSQILQSATTTTTTTTTPTTHACFLEVKDISM